MLEGNGLIGTQFTLLAKERIVAEASEDPYAEVSNALPELGIYVSAKEVDRQTREAAQWHREEQIPEIQWHLEDQRREAEAVFISNTDSRRITPKPEGLFKWDGWEGVECALISVDGAKARSPEKGPKGLLWFDVRCGLIRSATEGSQAKPFYTAGVMTWDEMFDRLSAVWRQRPPWVTKLVFASDDGSGIISRAHAYFPDAIIELDIYHASEHVGSGADAAWGEGSEIAKQYKATARRTLLEPSGPQQILRDFIKVLRRGDAVNTEELITHLHYIWRNRHHMRYHIWQAEGLPIGSGAMESAIKQVCVERLRKPGMMWTQEGADAMLRVRSACLSGTMPVVFRRKHDRARQALQRFLTSQTYSAAI